MGAILSFRDLEVYKRAMREAHKLFVRSKSFPREELYSLTGQIRRSSRAVSSMLAEAWARRRYQAAFVNKLNEAMGEAMETQNWLDHAEACEYISCDEHVAFNDQWQQIGAMLNGMIDRAHDFCRSAS
jgi:four helix bundle protein